MFWGEVIFFLSRRGSGFGVIRVNDEESNELLFLVRYHPIRSHGLIRWTLCREVARRQHTTNKLTISTNAPSWYLYKHYLSDDYFGVFFSTTLEAKK